MLSVQMGHRWGMGPRGVLGGYAVGNQAQTSGVKN